MFSLKFILTLFIIFPICIDKGVLELAGTGSYENIGGLCLNNKFSFREDFSLMNKRCFPDGTNLPMYVDMTDRAMNNENNIPLYLFFVDISTKYFECR